MKHAWMPVLIGLLVLTTSACQSETATHAPTSTPVPTSTSVPDLGLNLVVGVTGQVTHKRPGWTRALPLFFGVALQEDDLLQSSDDGHALVVCADLQIGRVPGGYHGGLYGQVCPRATPVLMRGESLVVGPQRANPLPESIPYIIRPRSTKLMEAYPLLKWHPMPDAKEYSVTVQGKAGGWTIETKDTEVEYPIGEEPLLPGTRYKLIVKDDMGRSSADEQAVIDLGFELLPAAEIERVKQLEARVRELPLDEPMGRFVVAELYAHNGLRADAIVVLETWVPDLDQPAALRRLGDLYLEVGLYREAASAYERARADSRTRGDTEGEAAASVGIGRAYWWDGSSAHVDEAQRNLQQAIQIYRSIGDAQRAEAIEAEVVKLLK